MIEITRKRLTSDSFWSIASAIFVSLLGIAYLLLIGNGWGSDGLGIFSICVSLYILGSILFNFGIHSAVIYEIASSKGDNKLEAVFAYTALFLSLFLGIISAILGFALARTIAMLFRKPEMVVMIRILMIAFPLFLVNKTGIGIMNAHRRMRFLAGVELTRGLIILAFIIGAMIVHVDVMHLAIAFVLSESLIFVLIIIACIRTHKFAMPQFGKARELLNYGWKLAVSNAVGNINNRLDILVIGLFWESSYVGVYTIASAIAKGFWIIPAAIQKVTNPLIVQLHSLGDKRRLNTMLDLLLRLGTAAFVLLGFVTVIIFIPLLKIVYPGQPNMLNAVFPFYFLIPGAVIFSGIAMIGTSVSSSIGHPENSLKVSVITLATNVLLNFILVPLYAGIGAAAATTISIIVAFVYFAFLSNKFLGFKVPIKIFSILFILFSSIIAGLHFSAGAISIFIVVPIELLILFAFIFASGLIKTSDIKLAKSIAASTGLFKKL